MSARGVAEARAAEEDTLRPVMVAMLLQEDTQAVAEGVTQLLVLLQVPLITETIHLPSASGYASTGGGGYSAPIAAPISAQEAGYGGGGGGGYQENVAAADDPNTSQENQSAQGPVPPATLPPLNQAFKSPVKRLFLKIYESFSKSVNLEKSNTLFFAKELGSPEMN